MEVSGKLCEKENVTELCEPCTVENVSNQADGFCKDCDEFMCQNCFGYHLRGKSCRNHVLDPISGSQFQRKLRTLEEKCKTHTSEFVKYYCSVHDCIGCSDCIVSNHRKCEPEFIRDLALNLQESSEFKSLISQLQNSNVEKAESETRIACYRKENNMLVAKALRDIKEFRRDIDCWLDKMETYIEAEVRAISDDNEKSFSQLQQMIVQISDDIDRINQLLDSNIHHVENLFIRMIECKPDVGLIDKTLSEVKSKLVFQRYKFEQEDDMKEMLKSSDKLGSIKVITKTEKKQSSELSTEDINMQHLVEGSCLTTESDPEDRWAGPTSNAQDFEYPLRAELEEELERIRHMAISDKEEKESLQQAYNLLKTELEKELEKTRQMAISEKEEKESLQQEYNKLKKELEATEAMLSRERENSIVMTTERDQTIFLLKQHEQEISSLKDLNTSLNSQLDSRNKEYGLLESRSIARQDQDHSTMDCLQSELKKTRDDHESLSRQIIDLQLQRKSANNNILDLQQQRESANLVISALKIQLKQKDETIDVLKQENGSMNNLNISLKSQLDISKMEFATLQSKIKVRQEQDHTEIQSLQLELTKLRENHKKEREILSSQIRTRESEIQKLQDLRAAGFYVGKRVKGIEKWNERLTGTVTAVDPSGYVDVKWDIGGSWRSTPGPGGVYGVKLL